MKVRLVSDLHVDINKTYDFGFNNKLDETDLTLIAGDIAGSAITELQFLRGLNHENPVIAVAGNHLGYDYIYEHKYRTISKIEGTKEWSIDYLRKNSPSNTFYIENEFIDIGDYIVYGGAMYTDFNLYNSPLESMNHAAHGLNDFKLVHTIQDDTRVINPQDYIKWYETFFEKLKEVIETTTKDLIIVTHFAPSKGSISLKYLQIYYQSLNPAYVCNLENYIRQNERIKLWVHGHMHDPFDYMIGKCRVVCAPYGYFGYEQMHDPSDYEGALIRI